MLSLLGIHPEQFEEELLPEAEREERANVRYTIWMWGCGIAAPLIIITAGVSSIL